MSTPVPPTGSGPPPPIEPGAGRGGCARSGLMGCGVAALVVLVVVVALFAYLRKRPAALTDLMMKQIESHYGPDVTEADKQELRSAYAEFRTALEARRVRSEALGRVRGAVAEVSRGSSISRAMVRDLAAAFRTAAGAEPPPRPATPVPVLTPAAGSL